LGVLKIQGFFRLKFLKNKPALNLKHHQKMKKSLIWFDQSKRYKYDNYITAKSVIGRGNLKITTEALKPL
jgi:hypothetical protein